MAERFQCADCGREIASRSWPEFCPHCGGNEVVVIIPPTLAGVNPYACVTVVETLTPPAGEVPVRHRKGSAS